MISLKEYWAKEPKENVYEFYNNMVSKPKEYQSITRNDMYSEIISLYKLDPEVILKLCTVEEIQILDSLIDENKPVSDMGYIEYTTYNNLKSNYLILESNEYYIPSDLINYVKMALNLYNPKEYSLSDVSESVLIGLLRILNVVEVEELIDLLTNYWIVIKKEDVKGYIKKSPKLRSKIAVVKYKKEDYVISKEFNYYKDILALKKENFKYNNYSLESVISIGKYKINLFKEEVFNFLSFLEMHLAPKYIDIIITELVIYCGFDLNDEVVLHNIADNIEPLYQELEKVVDYMPIWIYKGNDIKSIDRNIILPNKNASCPCGSGKKYKQCCGKWHK